MAAYKVNLEVELVINVDDRTSAMQSAVEIVEGFGLDFVKISDVCRVNNPAEVKENEW